MGCPRFVGATRTLGSYQTSTIKLSCLRYYTITLGIRTLISDCFAFHGCNFPVYFMSSAQPSVYHRCNRIIASTCRRTGAFLLAYLEAQLRIFDCIVRLYT